MADKFNILCIDDDKVDRETVARLLKKSILNTTFIGVESVEEGLALMHKESFDCILIDYSLPGRNGIEAFKFLREKKISTPIILLTGMGDEMLVVSAMRAGINDYLPKDHLSADILERSISNAVRIGQLEKRARIAERELAERELKYRTIVETVSDIIFQLSPAGKIIFVNSAVRHMGYEPYALVGKSFDILFARNAQKGIMSKSQILTRRAGNRATTNLEIELQTNPDVEDISSLPKSMTFLADAIGLWDIPSGNENPAEPLPEKTFLGSVCVARNISERKRAEKQLKAFTKELQRSNQDLQDFAYIASHDLQEPLRKIVSFSERLENSGSQIDNQGKEYLDRMQNAAKRMQNFIHDLLQLSRVTTRTNPFKATNLSEIIHEIMGDLESQIAQANATIKIDPLPELEVDPLQIRQLMYNLITNALKFKQPDQPPVIHISSQRNGPENWKIQVKDNGIGFDSKSAERIFKPFERLHGRTVYEGTGMGLAICMKIALRHGGDISAESQPGEGSVFTITLPDKPVFQPAPELPDEN